jgi:hypothetical protein
VILGYPNIILLEKLYWGMVGDALMSIARTAFAWFVSMMLIFAFGSTTERNGALALFCIYTFVYNDYVINEIPIVILHIDWDTYHCGSCLPLSTMEERWMYVSAAGT